MDVWAGYATRRFPCIVCTTKLEPGDRVIICQSKRTYPWGTRTRRQTSHFNCWVTQANLYLDDKPYVAVVPVGPGRKRKYTPEQAKRRVYLQITISRWRKQQQKYIGTGMWAMGGRYSDKISKIREELDSMQVVSND